MVIVGAGVAGLCLARALLDAGGPWSIVLVDGARDEGGLRALSFWSSAPTALDDLVRHRWKRLLIADGHAAARTVELASHRYQTLFLADLRASVMDALQADPRHRRVAGLAGEIRTASDRVVVAVGSETVQARWAFDSRFSRAELGLRAPSSSLLWQHFQGLVVRTATDVFDPSTVAFLDFRVELPAGSAFAYLLPFSRREALVELVTLRAVDAEPVLRSYLARVYGVEALEIVAREGGQSPLTTRRFEPFDGSRTRRIGIPGGRMKPSTGYALTRILDDSAAIVRALQTRGDPMVPPRARRFYRLLDGVFLTLWARWPERMPGVFAALFGRVPADRTLRFLDERASAWDVVALVARLPWVAFLRAFIEWVAAGSASRN